LRAGADADLRAGAAGDLRVGFAVPRALAIAVPPKAADMDVRRSRCTSHYSGIPGADARECAFLTINAD
jgi:hypothetical protein